MQIEQIATLNTDPEQQRVLLKTKKCDGCYNCLRDFDIPLVFVGEVQPHITDGRFGDHNPHLKLLNPLITQCLQKRLACYL